VPIASRSIAIGRMKTSEEGGRVKMLSMCVLASIAAACGPASPGRVVQEVVPLNLVPAGFEQEECWFEKGPEENPLFGSRFGLPGGAGVPPNSMLHILEHPVGCRHVRKEQPPPVVEDRNRFIPRQARCGGPDGLIRRCRDDEEG
jgi:hypothetical protein